MSKGGWIGFDFDGTLAHYESGGGVQDVGAPIPAMVKLVKAHLAKGRTVKIFTARVYSSGSPEGNANATVQREKIKAWCLKHIGQKLEVTNIKDPGMIKLYDDRAVQVITNKGKVVKYEPE